MINDLNELRNDFLRMRLRNKTWNRCWENIMTKYECDYVCELGVYAGVNFHEMIKHGPKLAVAIDSWVEDKVPSRNDGKHSQMTFDSLYDGFTKSVSDKPFVRVYREYTFDAVKHFQDNYFDLVYVDADHSYEGCLRDIRDWYPKVKPGKFLLGDDYRIYEGKHENIKFGVIEAVNDFAKEKGLRVFKLRRMGWGLLKK